MVEDNKTAEPVVAEGAGAAAATEAAPAENVPNLVKDDVTGEMVSKK